MHGDVAQAAIASSSNARTACPASTTLAKNDNYLGRCDGDRFGYFLGLTLALPAALPSAALRR
jgi:hypothetical protein